MNQAIRFSIIIPVYKDWKRLQLCLDALLQQTFSANAFEIIVVNNEQKKHASPPIRISKPMRLLHQPIPGSYAARNLGIKKAKGEILAFTDSDCIPDKNWLKNADNLFKNQAVSRIGGKIKLYYKNSHQLTHAELYESIFAFNQKENINDKGVSVTANFFVRKLDFLKIGYSDASKKSGEDWQWNQRATQKKLPIDYAENVIVKHPARHRLSDLARKSKRTRGGLLTGKSFLKKSINFLFIIKYRLCKPFKKLCLQKSLSFKEKWAVFKVIVYLFFVETGTYFKILFGGKAIR